MKFIFTAPFERDYRQLPPRTQKAFDKALAFLALDFRHPSLRAKKLPGTDIWYARVTRAYRFTFQHEEDLITLRRAGTHAVLDRERKR